MLHTFLSCHRNALIERCEIKAAERSEPNEGQVRSHFGIPVFLDQVIETLRMEKTAQPKKGEKLSGPAGGPSQLSELGKSATLHGQELSDHGFTIEQVVHDYGDLCQVISELSNEVNQPIDTDEFRTLNRCLDNGIADAVTEFSRQRRLINDDRETQAMNQRLGAVAHELRNLVNTASHALGFIKSGQVGFGGATGAVLDRTMASLREIVDHSLTDVRLTAGLSVQRTPIMLSEFIADVKDSAEFDAQATGCELVVSVVGLGLAVIADRELLFSAVINLLQNAFKFTQHGTRVSLTVYAEDARIRIDVQDHCGGLPAGLKEDLFEPFKRYSGDTSGVGLGLSICRRSVEANNGSLSVRDIPGSGCVFSIGLPRHFVL